MKSDLSLTQRLLNFGTDLVKQGTRDGETPLHKAVAGKKNSDDISTWELMGQLQKDEFVEILLSTQVKNNIKINPKCKDGISHLHIACIFNHIEAVELFVKAGESVDQATNNDNDTLSGYTPLHLAVRYSSVETVEILLRHGADIHIENAEGLSPLQLMIERLLDCSEFLTKGSRAISLPYEREVSRLNLIISSILEYRKADDILNDNEGVSAFHLACMLKDSSKAKYYLEESNVDINLPVKHHWSGWTPLHFAACLNLETLKLLLQRGAKFDVKNKKGYTALDLCLRNHSSEAVSAILSSKDVFTNIMLSDASTKLTEALFAMNNCNRFKNFLNNLTDANIFVPFDSPIWPGYSILHLAVSMNERIKSWEDFACRTDHVECEEDEEKQYNCTKKEQSMYWKRIKMCLAKDCKVSAKNADGLSPIHLAFKWQRTELVKRLLRHSRENVADSNNLSLLHIACASGVRDAVERFLKQGANVNDRVASSFEWHGRIFYDIEDFKPKKIKLFANSTPLHAAAMFGSQSIVKMLIEQGADVYAKDVLGLTPIHLTMEFGRFEHGAEEVLFNTPNLRDSVSDAGLSHLHAAVYVRNEQAVSRLLAAGANVNSVVHKKVEGMQCCFAGQTPLHLAAHHLNITRLLVRYGADVTVQNPFNICDTPLLDRYFELESRQPFIDVLMESLETGPLNFTGMTRLHFACATFQLDWAEELLKVGADPNAQQSWNACVKLNFTPLHSLLNYVGTVDHGMPPETIVNLVKLLLDYGANVLFSDGMKTPLHMVYRLICKRHLADDNDTRRSFHMIADLMLDKIDDFSVNPEDEYGFTVFHLACVRNRANIVEKYLDMGVDVNYSSYPFANVKTAGFTPLHFALYHGSKEVAYLLIERGAHIAAENRYGNTPLHSHIKGGYVFTDLIKILLDRGADINAKNLHNQTPIEYLIYYLQVSINYLRFFLSNGATLDIRKRGIHGEGIIGVAMDNASPSELDLVLETFIEYFEVEKAIKDGFFVIHNVVSVYRSKTMYEIYMKTIERFMKMGAELDEKNLQDDTALHSAISFGNLEAVKALLLLGADLNLVEKQNEPSLLTTVLNSDQVSNELAENLKVALLNHLWKMNFVGLGVASSVRIAAEDIGRTPDRVMVERCKFELRKATKTIIGPFLTLDMFLSEKRSVMRYPVMSIIQRHLVDEFFNQCSAIYRQFPELAALFIMHYRKILERMKLMQPVKDILISCNLCLPDLCLDEILKCLRNVDLEFLIEESSKELLPPKRQKVE